MKNKFQKYHTPWNKDTKGVMKAWNKGKTGIYKPETIEKISAANLGKKQSIETLLKRSKSLKLSWKDPAVRNRHILASKNSLNSGRFKRGQESLRKGKTYEEIYHSKIKAQEIKNKIKEKRAKQIISEEHKRKISEANKRRIVSEETKLKISNSNMGKMRSEETKKKLSLINLGKISPMKGKSYEDEYGIEKAKEIKQKVKDSRATQVFPLKDSSIELKIQGFLKQLGIDFFIHKYMNIEHGYQCDIFIPSMNMVIECDGDYWHKYPTGREIDKIRTSELIKEGFKVLRLWEHEINGMTIPSFLNKCKEVNI